MSVVVTKKTEIYTNGVIIGSKDPIVKSGLVFYVDINKPTCYTIGSTTIFDISGNGYTGTLYNGVSYDSSNGGSLSFDGANDYCLTTYLQPAYSGSTNFTWDLWCYPRSGSFAPMIGNRGSYFLPTNFIKLHSSTFEYYPLFGSGGNISYVLPLYTWSNICVVKNGTSISYYYNNTLVGSSISNGYFLNTNPFFIGGDNTANEYSNSKIASVKVYNKALNSSERTQNYNALKNRFGL